ncbi:MAG TPA: hypothetical protein VGW74_08465 [Propionibacteriaceae bacterium]|nr:hypothetical protein [Propionibacteriaceae bacterium]
MDRSATWVRTFSGPDGTDHQVLLLPMAAVHDVVERAPVGPLDRRERAAGWVPRVTSQAQNRSPGTPGSRRARS